MAKAAIAAARTVNTLSGAKFKWTNPTPHAHRAGCIAYVVTGTSATSRAPENSVALCRLRKLMRSG